MSDVEKGIIAILTMFGGAPLGVFISYQAEKNGASPDQGLAVGFLILVGMALLGAFLLYEAMKPEVRR